jgi:hypothetical protein
VSLGRNGFNFIAKKVLDLATLIRLSALVTYDKGPRLSQCRHAWNKSAHRALVEPKVLACLWLGLVVLYRQGVQDGRMCLVYDALFVAR